ncbi:MAG: Gfo/Idh/MocA family oxidoreductase [Anaerolineae bacterium]|nr:Gfo/Idh/MocA family oxidoreductase [Anaerolineae bacterium]
MKQFRVGIVGCGEAAQILHLPSLYQLADQFAVTALCDVSPVVMGGVGDHWQVPKRFADYHELVQQDDVDVVLIANPNAYHADVTLAAVEAGKHVLVEKPMCITLREADAIIAARQKANVVVQVGYMRRYAPAFVRACELVRQMEKICLARVHDVIGHNALIIEPTSRVIRGTDIPKDVLAEASAIQNRLIVEAIGDAPAPIKSAYSLLLGLSSHDISAMRELLGMPNGVLYAAQRQGGLYLSAAFDYGSYVCQFETGVDDLPRFDASLEVYGSDQVLRVVYDTPYVRNLPIRLVVTRANEHGVTEQHEHPSWGDAFLIEWQAFYDNIVNHQDPKTSAEDFRQDLVLFQQMIERMR